MTDGTWWPALLQGWPAFLKSIFVVGAPASFFFALFSGRISIRKMGDRMKRR